MRAKQKLIGVIVSLLAMAGVTLVTAPVALASTNVNGNITCLSDKGVMGIWVDAASGQDDWATFRYGSHGESPAWWEYTLTSGTDYQLHVGCGGNNLDWDMTAYSGVLSGTTSLLCYDVKGQANYGYCF